MRSQLTVIVAFLTKVAAAVLLALSPIVTGAQASDPPRLFDPNVLPDKPDLSGLARLRFLTSLDFPPFNFSDVTKRPTGFNVDLARAICATLEIEAKCEIQALPWDELEPALEAGRGEAIIAGNAITADARSRLGLSRAYFRFPARFVTTTGTGAAVNDNEADLASRLEGQTVAVERGTAHAAMLETYFPNAVALQTDNAQAAYAALRSGEAAYLFGDGVSLSFYLTSPAAEGCCVFVGGAFSDSRFLGNGMAVAVRKSDISLLQAIDHALAVLERNGEYGEIFARYFPLSPFALEGPGL